MLTRFTPADAYVCINSTVTSSGLHSTVTSAPGANGMVVSTAANSSAGTRVGVPPPTNTLVTGSSAARRCRRAMRRDSRDQMVTVGPRGERAVVAAMPTERDVDVDAELAR
jgi:hypothetical protein